MKKQMAFVVLFALMMCFCGCSNESASVGVIGGADGPTAILVTSNINWLYVCGFVGIIVVAILLAVIIRHNKKKK